MSPGTVIEAAEVLAGRHRILVFTGAGISTESGIPDFRGPNGLWKKLDPSEFTIRRYVQDRHFREKVWQRRFGSILESHEPNPGHGAVVDLWNSGRMVGCVTQNIDGLHLRAGLPEPAVAELHGNAFGIVCYENRHVADRDAVRTRWEAGDADPRCEDCGSILKSTTVLFGEMLPEDQVARAQAWTDAADAVVVVGSTLSVYPAAGFPLEIAGRGDPMVIVNEGPTDHDGAATMTIDGRSGEILPQLVDRVVAQAE